ncbi:MAG: nuclear transport factor 2 family protein [Acidimicrobiia bacterium]
MRLADRHAIGELFHAYARHFDRNEPEAIVALFTEDATVDYGPEVATAHGIEEVFAGISEGLAIIFAATSHHVSNISIEFVDPDHATAVAYVYAWHRYRNGAPDSHLWGQYHTRVSRHADEWRFAELVLKAAGTSNFHRAEMHSIGRLG